MEILRPTCASQIFDGRSVCVSSLGLLLIWRHDLYRYRCTLHSVVYLINTQTNAHIYIYYLINLKFTLKHLKRSYMFRSHDHPHGAYIVPC